MRKKFTMLFAALLAVAGVAKADVTDLPQITTDLENPIYYTIYNTRSGSSASDRNYTNGGLIYYAGDDAGIKDGRASSTLDDVYKFYFTGSHDAMYIHNAATGKKLASVNSWTDEGAEWAMGVSPKGGGLAIGPKGGLSGNNCINEQNSSNGFTKYKADDAGSIFVVELAKNYVFPTTDLIYTIECPLFENTQDIQKGLYVDANGSLGWNTVDLTNQNFYWIPTVKEDGTIAFLNLGTQKYLNGTDVSDSEVTGTIKPLGANQFAININNTNIHANGHDGGQGTSGSIVNWANNANTPSGWSFVQRKDPTTLQEAVVKYSFTYNGVEKYTQEVSTLVGEEWPAITVSFPYGVTSAAKPEGVIAAGDVTEGVATKEIALSVELPFKYAEDYESITSWYYMNIRDDGPTYMYYDSGINYIKATESNVPATSKDAYTWAFVGNPFDGFSIVNYAAGATMVLSSPNAPTGNKNADQLARMVVKAEVGSGNLVWNLKTPTHNNALAGAFYVEHPTATNYAFNRQSYNNAATVCYWNLRDTGSAVQVVKRDDYKELSDLIASAEAMGVKTDGVGTFTEATVATFNSALVAAKEITEESAINVIVEATATLQNAIAALKTVQPEKDKYYTIVSSCTKDHRAGQQFYVNDNGGMQFARVGEVASPIARVFQFVPATDGKFYIYNVERGVYMQTLGTATETDEAKAKPVTITNMGKDNIVKIVPDGQNMMHAQDDGSKIVGWNENAIDDGSAWTIQEVETATLAELAHTVTISSVQWATLVLGYDAVIPAGVKAYAVSSVDTYANLTEITGAIPAGQAVLLNGADGNYEFKFAASAEAVATNLLKGSTVNTTVNEAAYILAAKEGVVGLYEVNLDDNNAFTNNAFKVYLPASERPEGTEAPAMFSFGRGEGTTGIEQIAGDAELVIYDLAGRRVEKMEKGIYIVNGKKVVIK